MLRILSYCLCRYIFSSMVTCRFMSYHLQYQFYKLVLHYSLFTINYGHVWCLIPRWHNHLNPGINKSPWTEAEDELIYKLHTELGNQWNKIAQSLPGRTDNAIKNHWNSTVKRRYVEGGPVKKQRRKKEVLPLQQTQTEEIQTETPQPILILPQPSHSSFIKIEPDSGFDTFVRSPTTVCDSFVRSPASYGSWIGGGQRGVSFVHQQFLIELTLYLYIFIWFKIWFLYLLSLRPSIVRE